MEGELYGFEPRSENVDISEIWHTQGTFDIQRGTLLQTELGAWLRDRRSSGTPGSDGHPTVRIVWLKLLEDKALNFILHNEGCS